MFADNAEASSKLSEIMASFVIDHHQHGGRRIMLLGRVEPQEFFLAATGDMLATGVPMSVSGD